MIILEGVDKSGKTMLARELKAITGWDIKKFGIPVGDPIPSYINELQSITGPKIYDRFIYGEIPYSIVKQRPRYMNWIAFTILDLMVQSTPHLVVYCRPPREDLQDRLTKEPDDYVNLEEGLKLYEEYDELFNCIEANTLCYDNLDLHKTIDDILEFIKHNHNWEKYNKWKEKGMPGIGRLNAKYLFIGERFNNNAQYQITFWSKSGEYLFRNIQKAGIRLKNCHFTNAISSDINWITKEQLEFLAPMKIICLGEVAYTTVRDLVPRKMVSKIPHPAFWSRFYSQDTDDYIKMLREACTI